ncbi:citrate synthase, partial [Roseateles sp.]|uniref:citrate synthase n=1 Tax=Roseateles sp. TaxID=1971397 RepID=UPI002F3E82D0
MAAWMTLDEAREALGVRAQTIYAYVSRGRIGVEPDPQDSRRSLYRAEDVKALVRRKETGRTRETLAATTLFGAEPSIPTAVSTFSGGRPFYRGVDVVELAATATLEDAARLLWNVEAPPLFPRPAVAAVT